MASNGQSPDKHVKLLKRQRGLLVSQLPDIEVLLNTGQLGTHFSAYDKTEISKQALHSEKAERFLDIMEFKPRVAYQEFLSAIQVLRPELAVRLEGLERELSGPQGSASPMANGSPPGMRVPNGHDQRASGPPPPFLVREEAGLFGLGAPGTGPDHHLSHLGYTEREFLAARLNGQPPQRQMFHNFCEAMNVDNKLLQASLRSGNPTGYLIQQLCSKPEATYARLAEALNAIGQGELYQQLEEGLDDDDECN